MKPRFFTSEAFNKALVDRTNEAITLCKKIISGDYLEFSLRQFDFAFISDNKENLISLGDHLNNNKGFDILELSESEIEEARHELCGESTPIQINQEALVCWTLDLLQLGYQYDCQLTTTNCLSSTEVDYIDLSPEKEEFYFNEALKAFQNQNLFEAYFNWTNVLKINPEEPNSYYSRAIVKNKLLLWKDALRDLDNAIKLAPEFVDALNMRAKINYENGFHQATLQDLEKLIELYPQEGPLHYRKGDCLYQLKNNTQACMSWKEASVLGYKKADERISTYCKSINHEN